jgi:hypothetical protein
VDPNLAVGMPAGSVDTDFFKHNDVSAHFNGPMANPRWSPNTLVELGRRENRFAHAVAWGGADIPPALLLDPLSAASLTRFTLQGANFGEDRVLANLLAFDVRVFDPFAIIRADNVDPDGTVTNSNAADDAKGTVQPGDPGYITAITNNPLYASVGVGAHVDVGYGHKLFDEMVTGGMTAAAAQTTINNTLGLSQFAVQARYLPVIGRTYDSWAATYERDGIDQDNANGPDSGTDGLDNDGNGGVDEFDERDTTPPYRAPLRGIQVKIRIYEPSTRQIRQATVGWDFIPE